ncbi:MAG TPA: hypothetical protein VFE15_02010 [Marmoricola sp.]|jgi:hypothetical protein|nr:hypothetical protein [Marmoricola sp.]
MAFAARELVTTPSGDHFLVVALPEGGLKEITPTTGPVMWFSAMPGVMGVLGFLGNKLIFRGRWIVSVRPMPRGEAQPAVWRTKAATLAEANALVPGLVARLRNGIDLP